MGEGGSKAGPFPRGFRNGRRISLTSLDACETCAYTIYANIQPPPTGMFAHAAIGHNSGLLSTVSDGCVFLHGRRPITAPVSMYGCLFLLGPNCFAFIGIDINRSLTYNSIYEAETETKVPSGTSLP